MSYRITVQLDGACDITADIGYREYVRLQGACSGASFEPSPVLHIHSRDGDHYYLARERIISVAMVLMEDDE